MTKIINFVWIGSVIPEWVEQNIEDFERLNPDYEVKVHDESVLLPKYRSIYGKLEYLCSKADLLRYSTLQKFGGWYFDTDFKPLRPVREIVEKYNIDKDTFFTTRQQWNNPALLIANAVLYSETDNPAWNIINRELLKIQGNHQATYGPILFTRLVELYPELFMIGEADDFYPLSKENINKEILGNPFMIHLWAGGKRDL